MTNRAHVLLWTDNTAAYLEAIKAAGLADRVVIDSLPRKDKPSADQLARTEALMAPGVPPGLLPAMPKLRWAQSMTAGVEGWLARSDFVLLLLPATRDTNELINAERLGWMKPTAWLLNFGRGHLIKDADLIAAVKARKIAGAILDVFRQEPLPAEHPFWSTEGILVLPHIGGPHPHRDRFVAKLFVDNLGRFLEVKPLK